MTLYCPKHGKIYPEDVAYIDAKGRMHCGLNRSLFSPRDGGEGQSMCRMAVAEGEMPHWRDVDKSEVTYYDT